MYSHGSKANPIKGPGGNLSTGHLQNVKTQGVYILCPTNAECYSVLKILE